MSFLLLAVRVATQVQETKPFVNRDVVADAGRLVRNMLDSVDDEPQPGRSSDSGVARASATEVLHTACVRPNLV